MNVTIRTILTFKDILGRRELDLHLPEDVTVHDLLQELMRLYGAPLSQAIWDDRTERPARHVRLMVNGQDICFLDDLATKLSDGDELLILPPVAGG